MPLKAAPRLSRAFTSAAIVSSVSLPAIAHTAGEAVHAFTWTFEPWVVACLLASAGLYVLGLWRLWAHAGARRGVSALNAGAFAAGWGALALSLLSPLDTLGSHLFSVHMIQHEVLMLVAAPLMVLGTPLATWTWALPASRRHRVRDITHAPMIKGSWRFITAPLAAWFLHALCLWIWHVPALFEAALRDTWVHAAQHASFLFSALLFWWALLRTPHGVSAPGATGYLFTTMIHTGALGALMTIAALPWYPFYGATAGEWGLTPLEDQQLGGLIMWVPAGAVYPAVGLVLLAQWLSQEKTRAPVTRQAATGQKPALAGGIFYVSQSNDDERHLEPSR